MGATEHTNILTDNRESYSEQRHWIMSLIVIPKARQVN